MDPNLTFVYGPVIRNDGMPNNSLYKGKYYIYGKTAGLDRSSWYMDRNGVWNQSAILNGIPVGYYDTYKEAEAVFNAYLSPVVSIAAE